ncbi:MAG: DUF3021 family protein [Lachnospiraceae bacterium]|nr:DUF3021 family protein [Lachnospiraceae bacterium]
MKEDKKITLWERYLTKEIGIEFKACLYFFAILFFYCVYRMIDGVFDASIPHMGEMILICYVMGYIQVYLFGNFDEADSLGVREICGMIVCTLLYGLASFACAWFDRRLLVSALLMLYVIITYFCVFLIYKTKRRIDDKKLNEELKIFQSEHKSE